MDKKTDPNLQQKARESKIYSQKADLKTKELATVTGCPKIDPLSRKMAEIITQRELASLGVQTSDPIPKKPTFSIQNYTSPKAHDAKSVKKTISDLMDPIKNNSDIKPDEPEPNPVPQYPESKDKTPLLQVNNEENNEKAEQNIEIAQIEEEIKVEVKDKAIDNMEKIQAFQDELQREYPELALNEDNEGSSFHTNELDEIEKACKDLSPDIESKEGLNPLTPQEELQITPETKPKPPPINTDLTSNNTEYDSFQPEKPLIPNMPSRIDHIPQRSSLTDKRNCELFEVCSTLLRGKTEATTVTSRTPDIIRRQSLKLQESATKAQFLHFNSTPIGKYTPRCHINLNNCQSSPIFMSFRVPKESLMKSEAGLASADSLRKLLLRNLLDNDPGPQDFYSKSLEWLQKKEEKLEKTRELQQKAGLDSCTFDPFFEKHERIRLENETLDYKATIIPSLLPSPSGNFKPRIPLDTITYAALSPADNQLRYPEGFNLNRLLLVGKPMVHYASINLLK